MNHTLKSSSLQTSWVIILLATVCTALWGSASPAVKWAYILFDTPTEDISGKLLLAGIRFFLAGVLILLFSALRNGKWDRLPRTEWLGVSALGLMQTSAQYACFFVGVGYTTATKASLFSTSSVFFLVLLGPLTTKGERYTWQKILGCVLGFGGLFVVTTGSDLGALGGFHLMGEGLVFLSGMCFACSLYLSKRLTNTLTPSAVSAWQMVIGGGFLILVGFFTGGRVVFSGLDCYLLMIYMAALSSVALSIWSTLIKYNPISRVSIFHLLTPVFGATFSALLLGETVFTLVNLSALALVCGGIYLVNATK